MEGLDLTTIFIFSIVFLLTVLWYYRPTSKIPGPVALPIFGNFLLVKELFGSPKRDKNVQQTSKTYGPIFRVFLGQYQIVVVTGFKLVNEVLQKQGKDFINRPNWLPGVKLMRQTTGGVGIAMANGDEWKDRRRFTMRALKEFGVGKSSVEDKIFEDIQNISEDLERLKIITNTTHMMKSASCNIIHNIIFGFRYKHGNETLENLIANFSCITSGGGNLTYRVLYPYISAIFDKKIKARMAGFKAIKEYIDAQINEHRISFDKNNIRDFIDMYIEAEQDQNESKSMLDPNALFNCIVDLFTAGTDTTATTLDWSVLYMMAHPEVQKHCQDEISDVVGTGRNVRASDRKTMPYVEATLMEIQRVANTATSSLPHETACDTEIAGYKIPKKTIVTASLASVHFDSTIWENPNEFNPRRFLNEKNEIINKEYLIPFSQGPRVCLGESLAKSELFLIFTNLIQRFTFSKVDETDVLSLEGNVKLTRSTLPYRVKATPR